MSHYQEHHQRNQHQSHYGPNTDNQSVNQWHVASDREHRRNNNGRPCAYDGTHQDRNKGGAATTTTIDTNNSILPHAAKVYQPKTSFKPGMIIADPWRLTLHWCAGQPPTQQESESSWDLPHVARRGAAATMTRDTDKETPSYNVKWNPCSSIIKKMEDKVNNITVTAAAYQCNTTVAVAVIVGVTRHHVR